MKRYILIAQILFLVSVALIFVPHKQEITVSFLPLLIVLITIQLSYWFSYLYERNRETLDIKTKSLIYSIIYGVFLIWELLTGVLDVVNPVLYPAPERVFYVYVKEWNLILTGIGQSLIKLLTGIILAVVIGTFLGLIIGWLPSVRKVFYPICKVLSPIPPVVYVSYVIALTPTFASASIAVVFLGVFWPTLLSTISSVGNIDEGILISAKSMMVKDSIMMFRVILPYTLPGILGGMATMISFSFMTLTAAEMIGSTAGLGYFVTKYANYAMYDNVVCGIITIGIVVVLLNVGLQLLRDRLVKWK